MTYLVKTLSATRGAGLMLNIVIGAGLLALPGLVVEAVGSYALWAWAVCAITAIPLLIVFIIMGRRFPNAGGIAYFSKIAFGSVAYIATSFIFLGAVAFGLPAIALIGGHYISEIAPGNPTLYAALFIMIAASSHLNRDIGKNINNYRIRNTCISFISHIYWALYSKLGQHKRQDCTNIRSPTRTSFFAIYDDFFRFHGMGGCSKHVRRI